MNAKILSIGLCAGLLFTAMENVSWGQSSSQRREVRPPQSRAVTTSRSRIQRTNAQEEGAQQPIDPFPNEVQPAAPLRQPGRPAPEMMMEPMPPAEELPPGQRPRRVVSPAPNSVIRPYNDDQLGDDVDSFFSGEGEYCGPNGCGPNGCGGRYCGFCGDCRTGIYASGEVLAIWGAGQHLPVMVTTSPLGTARNVAGVLPGATTVYGDDDVNKKARAGGRARLGYWISDCLAIEADYVALGSVSDTFTQTSSVLGTPTIARPFVNVGNANRGAVNDADLIAFNDGVQGIYAGDIRIESTSSFESTGISLRMLRGCQQQGCTEYRADWTIGYRYARLHDRVRIDTSRRSVSNTEVLIPLNTVLDVRDQFDSENRFMGADLGMFLQCRQGCWTMDFNGRLGFGSVARQVDIDGQTTVTVPAAAAVVTPGGLLAQRTNMGRFRDDTFGFLPEVNIKIGRDINPCMRMTVGYNFFALTNVARAGEQIDTSLNLSQASNQPLVGTARPAFNLVDTSFWAHGISFGLEGDF